MKRLILAFVFCLFLAAPSFAKPTLTELTREIVCDCHDCGKQTVDQCMTSCSRGKELVKELRAHIDDGKNKEQIMDVMFTTYGEQVLGVPRQTNFWGKMAPIAPFLIMLVGIVPIAYITRTRQKKTKVVGPKQTPQKPIAEDDRLNDALKSFDY